jgi:hypothetical protein
MVQGERQQGNGRATARVVQPFPCNLCYILLRYGTMRLLVSSIHKGVLCVLSLFPLLI